MAASSTSSVVEPIPSQSSIRNADSKPECKDTSSNESLLEDLDLDSLQGRRIRLFSRCLKISVEKVVGAGRPEKMKGRFKDLHEKNPEAFSSITQQLVEHLRTNIENEVKLMIKQEGLVDLFSQLDKIEDSQEQLGDEIAWRPSGVPEADCRDHIMAVKQDTLHQLKQILESLEKENELLTEVVVPRRDRIIEKEKELIKKSEELDKAAELTKGLDTKMFQEQSERLKL